MLQRNFLHTFLLISPIFIFGIGLALIAGAVAGDSSAETCTIRLMMGILGTTLIISSIEAEIILYKKLSRKRR